jgi:hypothetical protein
VVVVDHLDRLLCKKDTRRRVENGISVHLPTPPTSHSRPVSPVLRNTNDMLVDELNGQSPKVTRAFDFNVGCALALI